MKLFVGLGNPGSEYAGHRHNIGFMALDRIAADHGFGPWKRAFKGLVSEGRLGAEKVVLLKPETFMNLSGQSVQGAMSFYKLPQADVTVLHDELDLAPGKCRVKQGGGHAGHNGLRSIHATVGEGYGRVRLGIGHPGHKDAVAGYVLHNFAKADQGWLEDLLHGLSDGAQALAEGDAGRFMNAVALRVVPPRVKDEAPKVTAPKAEAPKAVAPAPDAPKPDTPARDTPAPDAPVPETPAPETLALNPLQRLAARFRR